MDSSGLERLTLFTQGYKGETNIYKNSSDSYDYGTEITDIGDNSSTTLIVGSGKAFIKSNIDGVQNPVQSIVTADDTVYEITELSSDADGWISVYKTGYIPIMASVDFKTTWARSYLCGYSNLDTNCPTGWIYTQANTTFTVFVLYKKL